MSVFSWEIVGVFILFQALFTLPSPEPRCWQAADFCASSHVVFAWYAWLKMEVQAA